MARYFFNYVEAGRKQDQTGAEFDDLDQARIEAVKVASEVMLDHPTLIWTGQEFRVEVTDDCGLILFTVVVFGVDAAATKSL